MANGVAPVCHLIRSQIQPIPKRQLIPPIRRATDPASTQEAVNQIIHVLDTVLHYDQQPQWIEIERNTQLVRIHNPDDFDQWVEVERITRVVFQDQVTEAKLEWRYRY
jgi:hypothetical protein